MRFLRHKTLLLRLSIPALILAAGFLHLGNIDALRRAVEAWTVGAFGTLDAWLERGTAASYDLADAVPETVALQEEVRALARENQDLREMLAVLPPTQTPLIAARIKGFLQVPGRRQFWIDKGSEEGVREGAVLIAKGNMAIGVVEEVRPHHAVAYATVDAAFRATVKAGEDDASFLVRGDGEKIRFSLADPSFAPPLAAPVRTDGRDGALPADLLLGFLNGIKTSQDMLFLEGEVSPVVNIYEAKTVLIIL